jgi:hypothetical protein
MKIVIERVTVLHRERKAASENEIRVIETELRSMPAGHILKFIEGNNSMSHPERSVY